MDENIKWFSQELFDQFSPDDKKVIINNILSAFNEHRKASFLGDTYLKYSCVFDNVQMFDEHKGSENLFAFLESLDDYVEPKNRKDICKIEDISLYGIIEENKKIASVVFKLSDSTVITLTNEGVVKN